MYKEGGHQRLVLYKSSNIPTENPKTGGGIHVKAFRCLGVRWSHISEQEKAKNEKIFPSL